MGTVLSVFRAGLGAPNTTRESGGADDAPTSGQTQTGAAKSVIDKDLVSQTSHGAETQAATQTTEQKPEQAKEMLPNCFLEGELANWEQWEPTRIKESRLTPEERAKFQSHVDLIFDEKTIMGRMIPFEPEDVAQVMVKVQEYLESEMMLIEDVPFGVHVVADLHGQLYDLARVFHSSERDGKRGWENMKYVFLGNYVSRGRQSIEIVMALFCLKMLYPDRIFLLRGNHEFAAVNQKHGFLHDFGDRYDEDTALLLYTLTNEAFCYLSVAAIVGNSYFCAHAGISPAGFTRQQLKGVTKPFCQSTDDVLIHDIVWSDPAVGLRGMTFNTDRGTSNFFGFNALSLALFYMDVNVVIRGHSKLNDGWTCCWDTLYSLFTSTAVDLHGDSLNDGAFAVIDDKGKISIRVLGVDPKRTKWEKMLRRQEKEGPAEKCDGKASGRITGM